MDNFLGVIRLNNSANANQIFKTFQDKHYDFLTGVDAEDQRFLFNIYENDSKRNLTYIYKSSKRNISIYGYSRIDNKNDLVISLGIDSSETDEEILLKAYIKWGSKLPNKIIGSFAFVIYDLKLNKFICFRDHMGMKTFYYYKNDDVFIFSSRIKLILEMNCIKKEINKNRVLDYLMFVDPKDGETFYNGIFKLPRSHILEYTENKFSICKYFEFNINIETRFNSEKEYFQKFKDILFEVVDSHINIDDGDIGIAYSGGLDSTSLLKIADNLANTKSIFSKSAIFKNLEEKDRHLVDEQYFMNLGLENNKNVKHEYIYFEDDGPIKNIDDALEIFDQPISAINFYIFKGIALSLREKKIKVLLDGIDGDTVVSHGNEKFAYLAHKFEIKNIYKEAIQYADFNKIKKPSFIKIFKKFFIVNRLPHNILWFLFDKTELHAYWALKIFNKADSNVKKINLLASLKQHYGNFFLSKSSNPAKDHKQKISHGGWENSLEDLDYILNHYGIDHRMPFFDRRFMEFCLSVPVSLKLRNGVNRYIFREAMQKIVPDKIRLRSSKSDLSPPLVKEIKSIGKDKLIYDILNEKSPLVGLINKKELESFVTNTLNNNTYKNGYFLIFQLISLAKWMNKENLKW